MKLQLLVDHADGSAILNSSSQADWCAATACQARISEALTLGRVDDEVAVPSDDGLVCVRVGDVDRIDLIWEA